MRMRAVLVYMYVLSQFKLSLVFLFALTRVERKAQIVNVSQSRVQTNVHLMIGWVGGITMAAE